MKLAAIIIFAALSVTFGQLIQNCPSNFPPHEPPSDVRHLRANDISLMMAMGDSITAAFGAKDTDFVNGFIEYRSDSWSIGADPNATTAFNLFRQFNSSLGGGAIANTLPTDIWKLNHNMSWEVVPSKSHLNAAVSMAALENLQEQVNYLQNTTQALYPEEVKGWKILVLLIGANNLCCACSSVGPAQECYPTINTPEYWINEYDSYLEKIYAAFPKTYVAMMLLLNISQVWTVMENTNDTARKDYCELVRKVAAGECPCVSGGDRADLHEMDDNAQLYNNGLLALADKWNARNLPDFYISPIPFMANMTIPDMRFVSNLDCFHPSALAHQTMAVTLWNSLWVPYDQRPVGQIDYDVTPLCPTADMYLM